MREPVALNLVRRDAEPLDNRLQRLPVRPLHRSGHDEGGSDEGLLRLIRLHPGCREGDPGVLPADGEGDRPDQGKPDLSGDIPIRLV